MDNKTFPITPPPELVEKWYAEADGLSEDVIVGVATRAARWGADKELQACREWLNGQRWETLAIHLRAARRPKPLSFKEQALLVLDDCAAKLDAAHENILRRALEALDD